MAGSRSNAFIRSVLDAPQEVNGEKDEEKRDLKPDKIAGSLQKALED